METLTWYEQLRARFHPEHLRVLLVGESPPDPGAEEPRFFYAPTLSRHDNLYRGVAEALYGEEDDFDVRAKLRISRGSVIAALEPLAEVGPALVAGGYLESEPVVLVASPLYAEITVVSGDETFRLEENTNPIPGGASATTWMLHVPAPEPLAAWVREATEGSDHLTADPPPSPDDRGERAAEALVDLSALDALETSER